MDAVATAEPLALDQLLARLAGLSEKDLGAVKEQVVGATADRIWFPNPGPQTEAYFCEADELLYGGEPGGGKTDLVVGLSLTAHQRSLVLRRTNKEADKIPERYEELIGHRRGFNSQKGVWRYGERIIDIGGCQLEQDKKKRKGIPHDLKAFDELTEFTRTQYEFIITWNRSTDPKQRCRVVATTNAPTDAMGLWVVQYWAPWLDPTHPRPAKSGELRWFKKTADGQEVECDGLEWYELRGEKVRSRSRTFIRSKLRDNPDLAATDYASTLAGAGREMQALASGDFTAALRDAPNQAIPTAWVRAAHGRWKPKPPDGVPMCTIAADCTGGGDDPLVIGWRHDGWFAPLVEVPGKQVPNDRIGAFTAGVIISHRRDDAEIVIDMGGGYGGAAYEWLMANGVRPFAYKGAVGTIKRTADKKLGFVNTRSAAYWMFREALDPGQPGGSPIALPPEDSLLLADLTTPTFTIGPRGIEIESKKDVCSRLGRSTDHGDTVVMAWWAGLRMSSAALTWAKGDSTAEQGVIPGRRSMPQVKTGRLMTRKGA